MDASTATQDSHRGRVLARLSRVLAVALADGDLSPPQYRLLAFLSEGDAAATALAGWLSVSKPSVTALVDGLEAKGLVERRSDPSDRRLVKHVLTPLGVERLAAADALVDERLDTITAELPAAEAKRASANLALWGKALRSRRQTTSAKATQ